MRRSSICFANWKHQMRSRVDTQFHPANLRNDGLLVYQWSPGILVEQCFWGKSYPFRDDLLQGNPSISKQVSLPLAGVNPGFDVLKMTVTFLERENERWDC